MSASRLRAGVVVAVLAGASASAQDTSRVSLDAAGAESNGTSGSAHFTPDGRFMAFTSWATKLVPGDTNGVSDHFVRDGLTGAVIRVSVDSAGMEGNGSCGGFPELSADGRFVTISSYADNLVPGDTNSSSDIFVRDLVAGTTTRVSVDSSGAEANGRSLRPAISADGRLVAFESFASNLVAGDTNGVEDVFVHDGSTASTRRVSVDDSGAEGDDSSFWPSISPDGRIVGFMSRATNLVTNDTNGVEDAFVHGPYLTLEAAPESGAAGSAISLAVWRGRAHDLFLLAAVAVNGAPVFVPSWFTTFDPAGVWSVAGTVPPGLSGNVITYQGFGIVETGRVASSDLEPITFL